MREPAPISQVSHPSRWLTQKDQHKFERVVVSISLANKPVLNEETIDKAQYDFLAPEGERKAPRNEQCRASRGNVIDFASYVGKPPDQARELQARGCTPENRLGGRL